MFYHYSHQPNLTKLHGTMNGSGIKGAESARLQMTNDGRIKRRVYFYPEVSRGYPRPEEGLGVHLYQAELPNLYDTRTRSADSEKIRMKQHMYVTSGEEKSNAFERAVLDQGYDGYRTDNLAVVMNKDVPVKYIGTSIGKEFGNHTFTKPKPDTIFTAPVNSSGRVTSGLLTPKQISSWLKCRAELTKIAPSLTLEYGRLSVDATDLDALKQYQTLDLFSDEG